LSKTIALALSFENTAAAIAAVIIAVITIVAIVAAV